MTLLGKNEPAIKRKNIMKRKSENSVGEPGQFKTTPVIGFTPVDHTPTKSPLPEREVGKSRKPRNSSGMKSSGGGSAEKELKKRVLRHRRKGLND
jgi:hypothetical protein